MAISSDTLLERLHLKRQLTFWRLLTISVAIFFGVLYFEGKENSSPITGEYIARITISGVIEDNRKLLQLFRDVGNDDSAKALILWMDTPGGTTLGGEAYYRAVKNISKKKPVVTVMRTLCASAGYMIAAGTDYIVAGDTTLTGSIGVLMQTAEVTELAKNLGVSLTTLKSGPNKASPSFIEKFEPEQRKVLEETLMDSYDYFVEIVAKGRKMPIERVRELADGRVYSGRQAHKNGLVDELGTETTAVEWLEKERNLSNKLPIRDMKLAKEYNSVWEQLLDITGMAKAYPTSLRLDGMVSIWQPAGNF